MKFPVTSEQKETNVCVLAHSVRLLYSYTVQDPCLGNGTTHRGLGLPTSVNPIKAIPTDTLTGQPNLDSPSLRPSPQVLLGVSSQPSQGHNFKRQDPSLDVLSSKVWITYAKD